MRRLDLILASILLLMLLASLAPAHAPPVAVRALTTVPGPFGYVREDGSEIYLPVSEPADMTDVADGVADLTETAATFEEKHALQFEDAVYTWSSLAE